MSDAEDDVFALRVRQATKKQIHLAEVGKDAIANLKARQSEFLVGFYDKTANVIGPIMDQAKQQISAEPDTRFAPAVIRSDDNMIIRLVLTIPNRRPNLAFQAVAEKLRVLVRESIGDATWEESPVIAELSLADIEPPAIREYVASFVERAFS
jgi:hypothetical protein